jgi:hypothetical protein
MKRAVLILGSAFAVTVAVVAGIAIVRVDADRISAAAADRLARAIGYPVEIGSAALRLVPSPSVLASDLRVGAQDGGAPFITAEGVRFEIELRSLLLGEPAVRAIVIESPRLALRTGADGRLELPARSGVLGDARPEVQRVSSVIQIRAGQATIGDRRIEDVDASGRLGSGGTAQIDFTARVVGLGALRAGSVELTELGSDRPRWHATSDIADVDLQGLAKLAEIDALVQGSGTGSIDASGTGMQWQQGSLAIEGRAVDFRSEALMLRGDASFRVMRGKGYRAELGGAEVRIGPLLRKPAGLAMVVEGALPEAGSAAALQGVEITIGGRRLSGDIRLAEAGGRSTFSLRGDLDVGLVAVEQWVDLPASPTGVLQVESLVYAPPGRLSVSGLTTGVLVTLRDGETVRVDGDFAIDGPRLRTSGFGIEYLGQRLGLIGELDLHGQKIDVELDVAGADLETLTAAWLGEPIVYGRMYLRAEVAGPMELEALRGRGQMEIPGGMFAWLSIGDLLEGRVPERNEGVFQSAEATFEIRDGRAFFSDLRYEQSGILVVLDGSMSLIDGAVDFYGRAVFNEGREVLEQPMYVTGPLWAMRTAFGERPDPNSPEAVEQRRTELKMMEAMLETMNQRGAPPGDPEMQAEFARMRGELTRRIRAMRALVGDEDEGKKGEEDAARDTR